MPEGPEVYLNGQLINKVCKGRFFGGKIIKSSVSKSCEITFTSAKYTISCETRGKELGLILQCNADTDNTLRILFRFGMSGHFKFAPADEETKHAHLSFFTQDDEAKMALHFVDVRRFGSWEPCDAWGTDRGPDPMFDYEKFRANILDNLSNKAFNKPLCEVMLEQKFFNGIGNYLRSEIMYRAEVPPFTCARTVLEQVKDGTQKSPDFLQLCHDVPKEVINLGTGKNYDLTSNIEDHEEFNKWLRCYNNSDMDSMADHNKRMVWFKGDPGPMAPKGEGIKKKPAAKAKKGSATKKDTKKKSAATKKETKDETDDVAPPDDKEEAPATSSKEETTAITKEETASTKEETKEEISAVTSTSKEETATTSRPRRGKRKAPEPKEEKAEEETKPKRRKRGSKK